MSTTVPTLLLNEKPSQTIVAAEALFSGVKRRENMLVVGANGMMATFARGHLLVDPKPGRYDPAWDQFWRPLERPIYPKTWMMIEPPGSSDGETSARQMLHRITEIITTHRIQRVVIMTDPGPEGEVIARSILAHVGFRGEVLRAWSSKTLDSASSMKEAFASLKRDTDPIDGQGRTPRGIHARGLARRRIDYLYGMNYSRFFSWVFGTTFHYGRVKTVIMDMVDKRDRQIEAFVSEDYHTFSIDVKADNAGQATLYWSPPDDNRVRSANAAQQIIGQLQGYKQRLSAIKEQQREPPPLLFNLTTFQSFMNHAHGWSAERAHETLKVLHAADYMTYPRTNSVVLEEKQREQISTILDHLTHHPELAGLIPTPPRARRRMFDDAGIEEHCALSPTCTPLDPATKASLTPDQALAYEVIARSYLAGLSADHRFSTITITLPVPGLLVNGKPTDALFKNPGSTTTDPGWTRVYPTAGGGNDDDADDRDPTSTAALMPDGDYATVLRAQSRERQTKPPEAYTEGTLLTDVSTIDTRITDPEYKGALKGIGLGTSATRTQILAELFADNYLVKEQKKRKKAEEIHALPYARGSAAFLNRHLPHLTDPIASAIFERKLGLIATGQQDPDALLRTVRDQISADLAKLREITQGFTKKIPVNGAPTKAPAGAPTTQRRAGPNGQARYSAGSGDHILRGMTYAERQASKDLDGHAALRFDGDRKVWFVPSTVDPAPFAKWNPERLP